MKKTNPVPEEERRRGQIKVERGERTKEEMLMSVFMLPDPLISSPLSMWLQISVVESIVPPCQSHSSCLICQFQ